jgi:5'-3' exoribonuclease 1
MGIPLFFKTITETYDDDILVDVDDVSNNHGLFIDMNCAIHPCCRRVLDDLYTHKLKSKYEKKMIIELKSYLNKIIDIANPSFIYMAIDGVAPCSKMAQQRLRRFKTVLEKKEHSKIKKSLNIPVNDESWDTNAISPGTPFMIYLAKELRKYIATDPIFKNRIVLFSDSEEPGEGEHKILHYLRENRNELQNKKNIIYGLDADLIMLSLASKMEHIYLLREAVEFGKTLDTFLYMDIDKLNECIIHHFKELYLIGKNKTIENIDIVNDYIFICFLLGNDFLPHLISIDLRHDGLDIIMKTYVSVFETYHSSIVTKHGINKQLLLDFLTRIADTEDENVEKLFKKRQKQHKYFRLRNVDTELDKRMELLNNYPIINMDKELLITEDSLYTPDWRKRYYKQTLNISVNTKQIEDLCKNYIDGLYWTYNYYILGKTYWRWFYNYTIAPTLKDIVKTYAIYTPPLFTSDSPVKSHIQLLAIFPKESIKLIPQKYKKYMTDFDCGLCHLYPDSYQLNTLFKRYYWQCVPELPPLDITLIEKLLES